MVVQQAPMCLCGCEHTTRLRRAVCQLSVLLELGQGAQRAPVSGVGTLCSARGCRMLQPVRRHGGSAWPSPMTSPMQMPSAAVELPTYLLSSLTLVFRERSCSLAGFAVHLAALTGL